jgi:hypothetical protein
VISGFADLRGVFSFFIFFVEVVVTVCADPRPLPENNGFLSRERILGVSGRGGGYIGFGLDFWEPLGKMTEKLRKPQGFWTCWRFVFVGELGTSDK